MRDSTLRSSATVRRRLSRFWHKAYGDGLTGLAGMVAYNLLLSLLPLTLLALFVFGRVVRSPDVQASVIADIHRILPSASDHGLASLLREIRRSSTSLGIAALLSSIWIGSSFWGAIDTAFCRIYRSPCRSWLQQKRFALAMLVVVLVLFAATVVLPAVQSVVAEGADQLPFGLSARRTVYVVTLGISVVVLFSSLAVIYRVVPNERVRWRAVWPGAVSATVAIVAVDYSFPLYLDNSVLTTFGGTYVFVLIVLVWFYAVSLILLGGAVINALRLGRRDPD
ncbi:MAG: ribonuclease [Solirubrobacteraceae bacterium]|nr:ribonuclease [Solirubrobacteraceae bacterium]